MEVELVSKEGILFKDKAEQVIVPGEMGYMGILENHTPLLSTLKKGKIMIDKNGFDIDKGFIKVSDNYVIILAEK
ncbi:MAG: hypothetical protein AB1397_05555 [bacterium]